MTKKKICKVMGILIIMLVLIVKITIDYAYKCSITDISMEKILSNEKGIKTAQEFLLEFEVHYGFTHDEIEHIKLETEKYKEVKVRFKIRDIYINI